MAQDLGFLREILDLWLKSSPCSIFIQWMQNPHLIYMCLSMAAHSLRLHIFHRSTWDATFLPHDGRALRPVYCAPRKVLLHRSPSTVVSWRTTDHAVGTSILTWNSSHVSSYARFRTNIFYRATFYLFRSLFLNKAVWRSWDILRQKVVEVTRYFVS